MNTEPILKLESISDIEVIKIFEHIFYSTHPYQPEQYRPMIKDFLKEENIGIKDIIDEIE